MIRIVTIVGARPQFIKAAAVSRVIRDEFAGEIEEILVHTGQHYDENMSLVFFDELDIPRPGFNLEIAGGSHGVMTGRMLEAIENVLFTEKPDWVLVYGDTNSTLAGALAAAKLHIPVAHVEAGLRSFNMRMPEEINRILADRVSSLLFCPTENAVRNLSSEGLIKGVHNVGDVMFDVALFYRGKTQSNRAILKKLKISEKSYALATVHRAENTDSPDRLEKILMALSQLGAKLDVVLPLHPRTRRLIDKYEIKRHLAGIKITDPLPFLDMVALERSAKLILTDSGGVQKEAFFYGVPCITMRDETEWVETVWTGANKLVDASYERILDEATSKINSTPLVINEKPYGDGTSANAIVNILLQPGNNKRIETPWQYC